MKQNKNLESPDIEQPSSEKPSNEKSKSAAVDSARSTVLPDPNSSTGHNDDIENNEALPRWRLYLLGFALGVTNLLVALDTSVLGPAIPTITSEFHSIDHIGWYSSAYLLTLMPCQLVLGRLSTFYEPKLFYMLFIGGFEVGSIICATAPTSAIFIFGRAVAGFGAAGITVGGFAIVGITPMRERPRLLAFFAALQAVAYTSGPTISGILTDSRLTWRFNFWINMPLGFMSLVFVHFVIDKRPDSKQRLPFVSKLQRCDPVGAALLVACLVSLFLALEWGGNVLPYSSPQVWGCFLASGMLAIVFTTSQAIKKDNSIIPLRILKQRTVAVCCVFSALYGMANVVHITLLPTYLQTVHDISATLSGVYQLPITFSNILSITLTGFAMSAWGYYVPFLWVGPLVYLVGSVLFQRLQPDSTAAQYIGYQAPVGAGFGIAVHSSLIAIQAVSSPEDMPIASVMEMFSSQLGRAIGISVAQSLFVSTLQSRLREIVPSDQANTFASEGLEKMVSVMHDLDAPMKERFQSALNTALTTSFIVPVVATTMASVATWFVERRSIREVTRPSRQDNQEVLTTAIQ